MKSLVSCLLTNLLFFIFLLAPLPIYASEEKSSNEIYTPSVLESNLLTIEQKNNILVTEFMPNPSSGEFEWVELYNANDHEVILNNWYIDDVIIGGATPIAFSITIGEQSYKVIELIKSMLNNTGNDSVSLLDENKFPLHIVNYAKTVRGSSIQKVENLEWVLTVNNTKGAGNLVYTPLEESNPKTLNSSSTDEIYSIQEGVLENNEKENISITEFYPYPNADQSEWVEIYNDNDHEVALKNWFIDDELDKGGSPFSFNTTIKKKSYAVVELGKSLLNNSGDSVSLLDENKFPLHVVNYDKSVKGSSVQKIGSKWYITVDSTKNKKNLNLETYKPPITNTENSELVDINTNIKVSGDVLGTSTQVNYRTIPIYDLSEENYLNFSSKNGKVYVISEKQMPNSYQKLVNFFEKAFW